MMTTCIRIGPFRQEDAYTAPLIVTFILTAIAFADVCRCRPTSIDPQLRVNLYYWRHGSAAQMRL